MASIVSGEGQRQQRGNGDEIGVVAHPVVMGPLLLLGGAEKAVGGIGADDRATEGDVGDHAMQVDRVPQEIMDRRHGVAAEHPCRIDTGRAHHESQPGVGEQHQQCSNCIEQQAERQMHPFAKIAL